MLASFQKEEMNRLLSQTGVYAAIGWHPRSALVHQDSPVEIARRIMSHPKVVAVGEIGEG